MAYKPSFSSGLASSRIRTIKNYSKLRVVNSQIVGARRSAEVVAQMLLYAVTVSR